jgi:hypothetical protein
MNVGDPQPDRQLEVAATSPEISARPGDEVSVLIRLTNTGSAPITDLRASFQSRVDFRTSLRPEVSKSIAPGESIELTYKMEAPSHVNVQCLCNRIAYGHWSAIYRRNQAVHLAHAPVLISLQD